MSLCIFFFLMYNVNAGLVNTDICDNFLCENSGEKVCALKSEGEGYRIKLFESECDLIKYECEENNSGYDVVSMDFCLQAFKTEANHLATKVTSLKNPCTEYVCSKQNDAKEVCGIKKDEEGFRVRYFKNKCELWKYNCEENIEFDITDLHICSGKSTDAYQDSGNAEENNVVNDKYINNDNLTKIKENPSDAETKINTDSKLDANKDKEANNDDMRIVESSVVNDSITEIDDNPSDTETKKETDTKPEKLENIVVVRSPNIDFWKINESIDNFFAGTHVFDLPVREMDTSFLNETTRRRLIRVAKPIKVFVPFVIKPKNVSEDHDHIPTLGSCYHKCPRTCPATYAPVCGVPGQVAREPSLMFQNHCFMDVAQCKMYWENKSPTALSSAYVESSFIFCLGNEMNSMFRFLPLIRTLQHMGRLRKRGRFHYQFRNLKFFHNMLFRQPKLMG